MLRGGISGLGSAGSKVGREVFNESGVMDGFMTGADVGAEAGVDAGADVGANVGPGTASEARDMSETFEQVRVLLERDKLVESHTSGMLAHAAACSSQVAVSRTRSCCIVDQDSFVEISFPLVVLNNSGLIFVVGVDASDITGSCIDGKDLSDSILLVVDLIATIFLFTILIEYVFDPLIVLSNRGWVFASRTTPLKSLQVPEKEASFDVAHDEHRAVAMFLEEAESHVEWFHVGHIEREQSLEPVAEGRTCWSSVSRHGWFWRVVVT